MKKVVILLAWLTIYLGGVMYVTAPSPVVPDLPEALKSDEPGDTWQNKDTKAFFTDWSREQVISYYRQNFRLKIFGIDIPNLRLNYRPEDTGTYVRKHIDSYYLEEIVIPLRESVFINGWDPKNSPTLSHLSAQEREKIIIVINGKQFQSKITLKWYQSQPEHRLLTWTLTWILTPIVFVTFLFVAREFVAGLLRYLKLK